MKIEEKKGKRKIGKHETGKRHTEIYKQHKKENLVNFFRLILHDERKVFYLKAISKTHV